MINKIHNIDALTGLKKLEDESIDCIITSPPYYQLRDYGHPNQIGLENSFEEYIDKLVEIFNECKRVLKSDGTMWINIGDTYNGAKIGKTDNKVSEYIKDYQYIKKVPQEGIKEKSLLGIPARLSLKLIDAGWVLRNKIIWNKPNAMPSSVVDRFTVDYEEILFFTKSSNYYFKQLKEPMKTRDLTVHRGSKGTLGPLNKGLRKQDQLGKATYSNFNNRYTPSDDYLRNMRATWTISTTPSKIKHFAMMPAEIVKRAIEAGCKVEGVVLDPFAGSGTTAIIAKKMNRDFIGFEINAKYSAMAQKRISKQLRLLSLFNIEKGEVEYD
ncbi:MAG TPA: site-specific DNA-methyltransferase [Edaphocola sp.]|nr:site-specific DNA-methyltransferase [Edaphocola sp.]